MSPSTPVAGLVSRIGAVHRNNDTWTARCPGHEDRHASLSLSQGDDGRALLHCHAGCETEQIVVALGLSMADLFDRTNGAQKKRPSMPSKPASTVQSSPDSRRPKTLIEVYDYRDEDDKLRYQVCRFDDSGQKTFLQRRPDGKRGWISNLNHVGPLPYRLPELLEAPRDEIVFATEGEKDADRLRSLGLVATCNSGGAGKFQLELAHWFEHRQVVVVEDNDEAGRRHADKVIALLNPVAESVRRIGFPELGRHGADVSDWLDAGNGIDDLLERVEKSSTYAPIIDPEGRHESGLNVITLSTVVARQVQWLWNDWVAMSKLALLVGDPGVGKSTIALDIAARCTVGGPWPDGGQAPMGDVVLITAEDALDDTVRPRLDRIGGDPSRIHAIGISVRENDKDVSLSLVDHMSEIEQVIAEHQAVLLIVDPLLAIMGRSVDSYKTSEVRPVLAQLVAMAERTECAVVAILHLNKRNNEGNSLYRVTASLDFTAAARSVLVVGRNPDDAERRVLASGKSNLSAPATSVGFHFTEDGTFTWEQGAIDVDANSLLATSTQDGEDRSALAEARDFLLDVLSGGSVKYGEIKRQASQVGFQIHNLRRAKRALHIRAVRISEGNEGNGAWAWELPDRSQDEPPPRGSEDVHLAKQNPLQHELCASP